MRFNSVYGIIALISGGVMLLQLVLTLIFGGLDIGADVDTDTDTDSDTDSGSSGSFELVSLISPKGILHFLVGGSWYLVLAEYVRGSLLPYDWVLAIVVGFVCSLLIGLLYWGMYKLQCEKVKECGEDLVGRSGEIYLCMDTNFEIFVPINGMKSRLIVLSKSNKKYKTGDVCTIVSYENGVYYIE